MTSWYVPKRIRKKHTFKGPGAQKVGVSTTLKVRAIEEGEKSQ